jgi:hypothetical protein
MRSEDQETMNVRLLYRRKETVGALITMMFSYRSLSHLRIEIACVH